MPIQCGCTGQELLIGTGAMFEVNGMQLTRLQPAPIAKYKIVKIHYDSGKVNGYTSLYSSKDGLPAFPDERGGDIYVGAMNLEGFRIIYNS